jgi:hypothetical protein
LSSVGKKNYYFYAGFGKNCSVLKWIVEVFISKWYKLMVKYD